MKDETARKKRLLCNTVSSLVFQIVTLVCGFIVPRLILDTYGSSVNGLVLSITQILGMIAFLELGVGAVVQSSLYKPLAEKNINEVSKIISSANKFFRRLASILVVYVIFLVILFPFFAAKEFGYGYSATLILTISISTFAQYYFGIVNRILLTADQRGYIQYITQTIAVICNTIACYILIALGCRIQIVKLATSIIYLIQPFAIYLYVRGHYQIDKKIKYDKEPIAQKWNGIAQHVAAVILDGTDTVVLTLFSTLSNVSIYSVYFMVVRGIKQLFMSLTNDITSLIGELWAKQELNELKKTFGWTEWLIHTGTVFIFGVTAVTIVPFIKVYTLGINDAIYIQYLFAALLVAANATHCLRLPYNIMILAAGHYKQTQSNYLIAAAINIIVSIIAVKVWGLVGVAIGTLIAMSYQTIWMAWYNSKNLLKYPIRNFVKQLLVDIGSVALCAYVSSIFSMKSISYFAWIIYAIKVSLVWIALMIAINLIFYKEKAQKLFVSIFTRHRFSS